MTYSARYYDRYSHYLRMDLDDVPLFRYISAKCARLGRGRMLDVGCGLGYLLNWLAKQGWDGVGLDSSAAALGANSNLCRGLQFVRGSAYDLPFADGTFDAVLAINIVEHLDSPRELVSQMVRVLKPGGTLVLSTPEMRSLFKKLFIHDGTHVHEFTKEEIVGLLSEYGTVIDVTLTNSVGRLGRGLNNLIAWLMPCDILVEAKKADLK